jgi:hypothetical protein
MYSKNNLILKNLSINVDKIDFFSTEKLTQVSNLYLELK